MTARGLANMYARTLGELFLSGAKPFEVEIGVAEVGVAPDEDRLYQITFDGTLLEHRGLLVLGGNAPELQEELERARPRNSCRRRHRVDYSSTVGYNRFHVQLAILDRDPQTLRGSHRADVSITGLLGARVDTRIIGVETEYEVHTVHPTKRPLAPDEVARYTCSNRLWLGAIPPMCLSPTVRVCTSTWGRILNMPPPRQPASKNFWHPMPPGIPSCICW